MEYLLTPTPSEQILNLNFEIRSKFEFSKFKLLKLLVCFEHLKFRHLKLFRISPAFAEAASRRQVLRISGLFKSYWPAVVKAKMAIFRALFKATVISR
jgi:hypothetical protein